MRRFTYSFTVWPDEKRDFDRALFDLFRTMSTRVEMVFTEDEFKRFRSSLGRNGFILREIERIPHVEPQPVP